MLKIVRFLIVAVVVVVALPVLDRNYGSYSEIYECTGKILKVTAGQQNPATPFVRVTKYRWWRSTAGIDGALRFEIPVGGANRAKNELFAIKELGSYLVLFPWPKAGESVDFAGDSPKGQFSTISDTLALNISDGEQFQGSCKKKNS